MALQEYLEPVSGVYQCHVTNQYGVAISNTVLCAQSELASFPGPLCEGLVSTVRACWNILGMSKICYILIIRPCHADVNYYTIGTL